MDTNKAEYEVRLMNIDEACAYIGMGKSRGREALRSIGAEKRIYKRCLYDKKIIDAFLDSGQEILHEYVEVFDD